MTRSYKHWDLADSKVDVGVFIAVTTKVIGALAFLIPSFSRLASWNLFQGLCSACFKEQPELASCPSGMLCGAHVTIQNCLLNSFFQSWVFSSVGLGSYALERTGCLGQPMGRRGWKGSLAIFFFNLFVMLGITQGVIRVRQALSTPKLHL